MVTMSVSRYHILICACCSFVSRQPELFGVFMCLHGQDITRVDVIEIETLTSDNGFKHSIYNRIKLCMTNETVYMTRRNMRTYFQL